MELKCIIKLKINRRGYWWWLFSFQIFPMAGNGVCFFSKNLSVILYLNVYYIVNRRYVFDFMSSRHLFYTHLQFSTTQRHRRTWSYMDSVISVVSTWGSTRWGGHLERRLREAAVRALTSGRHTNNNLQLQM